MPARHRTSGGFTLSGNRPVTSHSSRGPSPAVTVPASVAHA